jgi:hypothetical protein
MAKMSWPLLLDGQLGVRLLEYGADVDHGIDVGACLCVAFDRRLRALAQEIAERAER